MAKDPRQSRTRPVVGEAGPFQPVDAHVASPSESPLSVKSTSRLSDQGSSLKASETRRAYASSPIPSTKRQRRSVDAEDSGSSPESVVPIHQRACERCKSLKVKCEVKSLNGVVTEPCRRCKNANHPCVLPGTKQRRAPPKRGDLLKQIQDQAVHIKRLEAQLAGRDSSALDTLVASPPSTVPSPAASTSTASSPDTSGITAYPWTDSPFMGDEGSDEDYDVSAYLNANLFQDLGLVDPLPPILSQGVITMEEAGVLFRTYFDFMNPSMLLLDPILYTAQKTSERSPLLFTVVCAIASRFSVLRPGLHELLMSHAQLAAGSALTTGQKNIELVHAFLLLAVYPNTCRQWEDDRSWIQLGLAIRVAMDLNMHYSSPNLSTDEVLARESLNRARAWRACLTLDHTVGTLYGKDSLILSSGISDVTLFSSLYDTPGDAYSVARIAQLRCVQRFTRQIGNQGLDPIALATTAEDELLTLEESWSEQLELASETASAHSAFLSSNLRLSWCFSRLVVLSTGLEYASVISDSQYQTRCSRAMTDFVNVFINDYSKVENHKYIRHLPDYAFAVPTFACAFAAVPSFTQNAPLQPHQQLSNLVHQAISLFESPDLALDLSRGAPLHARLLSSLLATPVLPMPETITTIISQATQGFYAPQLFSTLSCLFGREHAAFTLMAACNQQDWLLTL